MRPDAALQDEVETALEAWPDTTFLLQAIGAVLYLRWSDGPSAGEVEERLLPQEGRTAPVRAHRSASGRSTALLVGVDLLREGTVGLPPAELYDRAGLDPDAVRPHDRDVRLEVLHQVTWGGEVTWEGTERAAGLKRTLRETDLTEPRTLLTGLGPEEVELLECFATLAVDAGACHTDEVLLWAASGGWELARLAASRQELRGADVPERSGS